MSWRSGEWWENPVLTLFYSCLQGWDIQCFTQWEQERGWQTTVFKGHKEFSGLWSFVAAMGGGSLFKGEGGTLICNASQHKSQVAEPLDHCTMRSTWTVREVGGWEHKWDRKGGGGWPECYGNSITDSNLTVVSFSIAPYRPYKKKKSIQAGTWHLGCVPFRTFMIRFL